MRFLRSRSNPTSSIRTEADNTTIRQRKGSIFRKNWYGPYRITSVCGPAGIGQEPKSAKQKIGFWFIAKLPDTDTELWVKADHTEDEIMSIGVLEDNFIGLHFEVFAEGNRIQQLSAGKAKIMDSYGSVRTKGASNKRMKNRLESTVPTSVAGICGPFGLRLPDIGEIMSKLGVPQGDD